jgi:hypothetical protein
VKIPTVLPIFLVFCLFLTAGATGQSRAPVPAAIPEARSVFISNGGADCGLFPQPFSGDQDRVYDGFYGVLKASGAFVLAPDPAQADLVLELRLLAPYGPTNANKQNGTADPRPMFRLVVWDRRTHYALWTATQSIELAFRQATHDRNFDSALAQVANRFLALAEKPPVPVP